MRNTLLFSYLVFCPAIVLANPEIAPPSDPLYASLADDVYLQEVGEQIVTDQPVTALATFQEEVFAIVGGRLCKLIDGQLVPSNIEPQSWKKLLVAGDSMWGTTVSATYRFDAPDSEPQKALDQPLLDVCVHLGTAYAATSRELFRLENDIWVNAEPESGWLTSNTTMIMADGSQVLAHPVRLGPTLGIASFHDTLYLIRPDGPTLLEGRVYREEPVDWGVMPPGALRDVVAQGSRLYMATSRGVAVLRGAALTVLTGADGLPQEDTTCLAEGFAGELWIGTTGGAVRKIGREYHFFGASQWLPGERVYDIAVRDSTVFVATDGGVGIIRYEPFTLRKKADYYERDLESRGHHRLGFVHKLYWSNQENAWLREISDNDGGHTSHYLAAMCFKYAATGSEEARQAAIDSMEALIWLRTITGVDGFFARAIWAVDVDQGRRSTGGSGGLPAKWRPTDDGNWLWKGDTSSDEVNAHFYATSLFHDLVAEGKQKEVAAEHLAAIAKHIIDNGWVLRGKDGEPTRWGRWDPEYLQRPYGFEAIGLNGMEAQTYMWTALKLTGDPQFQEGLQQLLRWRYDQYTVREKVTFPPESVVPWDDELAFRCFLPLVTYCDDPRLRSIYVRALARHWEVLRRQRVPYFNFLYGGITGNDCESAEAVQHLRDWSLDTVSYSFRNSHREDLAQGREYPPYWGATRAISPRNQASSWGSRPGTQYDSAGGGRTITPPVGWLEDYWMGRFFGMIEPPQNEEEQVYELNDDLAETEGAAPYDGPEMPEKLLPR